MVCYVVVVVVVVCFSASPDISINSPTTNTTITIQQLFQFNQNDKDGDARCTEIILQSDSLLEGNESFTVELGQASSSIEVIMGTSMLTVIIMDTDSKLLSGMTLYRFSLHKLDTFHCH